MTARLFVLLLLAFLIWRGLGHLVRRLGLSAEGGGKGRVGGPGSRPSASSPSAGGGHGGELVRCPCCGAHFPLARAVTGGPDGLYCSSRCREESRPASRP